MSAGMAPDAKSTPPWPTESAPIARRSMSSRMASGYRRAQPRGAAPQLLLAAVVEVLLQPEERQDEDREQRGKPHDHRGADPRSHAADVEPIREDVGDQ